MKLTDALGQVVAEYTYGTYGELLSGDTSLTHYLYNGRCGVSTDENGLYYMRQRYYNPEIKRFVNQDILTGNLSNSQSLNQYSYVQGNPVSYTDPFGLAPSNGLYSGTNKIHSFLGVLSIVPGPLGFVASIVDGLVYAVVDQDYFMAAVCAVDALGFPMSRGAMSLIKAGKYTDTGLTLLNASKILSNTTNFAVCANATMAQTTMMYDKYVIQGQEIGSDFAGEIALTLLPALGGIKSAAGMFRSVGEMGRLVRQDGFLDSLKRERAQLGCEIKSTVKGGVNCFVAGTQVHTENGTKSIEDIRVGDYVLAYNEETGETGYKKVVNLFRNTTEELVHVKVDGTEEILCTPGHKFFVEGEWVPAEKLKTGDILTLSDGAHAEILSITIEKLETPVATYNFEVEDWHTYYVADSGVLVHNMCAVNNTAAVNSATSGGESGSGSGEVLGDDALVVRGGMSDSKNLSDNQKKDPRGHISANAANGVDLETLATTPEPFRNGQISVTTVGEIRRIGMDVIPDPTKNKHDTSKSNPYHVSIIPQNVPMRPEEADALSNLFNRQENKWKPEKKGK